MLYEVITGRCTGNPCCIHDYRITSYNVCYTKLLRRNIKEFLQGIGRFFHPDALQVIHSVINFQIRTLNHPCSDIRIQNQHQPAVIVAFYPEKLVKFPVSGGKRLPPQGKCFGQMITDLYAENISKIKSVV